MDKKVPQPLKWGLVGFFQQMVAPWDQSRFIESPQFNSVLKKVYGATQSVKKMMLKLRETFMTNAPVCCAHCHDSKIQMEIFPKQDL